ncbi:MAG: HAD family hydrolase [Actinomycetota bacterium]|nr:HAD family hydrolase [Actinomycetota bacterium]
MRCALAVVGLLLVVLGGAACRVDATVTVDVADDGTGHVDVVIQLDAEAVDAIGGLEDRVWVADLADAGWTVDGPHRTTSGLAGETIDGATTGVAGAQVTVRKAFDHPDHLGAVLAEVVGPTAISDVRLLRQREFAETTWSLDGRIDLSAGLDLLADAELAAVLDGLPFARSDAELAELAGCGDGSCDPASAFSLTLVAVMPTDPDGVPAEISDSSDDDLLLGGLPPADSWTVVFGDPEPTLFQATGVLVDDTPRIWRTVSIIAGTLFVLVAGFQLTRLVIVRRRRRVDMDWLATGGHRSTSVTGDTAGETAGAEASRSATSSAGRTLRLVVLGGIGVVWDPGNDPEGLLVPFVRDQGGVVDPSEVADRYRAASLGHLSSGEFWTAVGVPGNADVLDSTYLSRVRMRADVLPFLDRMEQRGLPVACLSNAVLPWSMQLRQRFGLDDRVDPWVVSGGIGARKPSPAMFEALRRMSGVDYHDMLLIDSEPNTLDAARYLGMSTVLLRGSALVPEGFSHPVIDGFAGLFRARPAGQD